MNLRSPLRRRRTRLEIIPLIDIMFFLLASFMMVSLQMQKVRTLKASLPTATVAASTAKPDMITLTVDKYGHVVADDKPVSFPALLALLTNRYAVNTNLPVYIAGQRDATHGSMMYVLDFVKRAGIQRVAFALCGLCVFQWYGQTRQRDQIEKLNQLVYEKSAAIQAYTNSIQTLDRQIAQMDAHIVELKQTVKTNDQLLMVQKREINKLQVTAEGLTNTITDYKQAVGALETKLKDAFDGIKKQNEALKELAAQRDEFVTKFNDSVKERNEIVAKYNELAARVEKIQGGSNKQ